MDTFIAIISIKAKSEEKARDLLGEMTEQGQYASIPGLREYVDARIALCVPQPH